MISTIINFELKQRLKSWLTAVFYAILVFQGIWYTFGTYNLHPNVDVLMNSSVILYQNLSALGLLMCIIVIIVTGQALYKDIGYKTGAWVYSVGINEKKFFFARFLSAFLYNVFLSTGYFIGMLIVPYVGLGTKSQFGPALLGQMLHACIFFMIPGLFLITSMIFCVLAFTRRIAVAYVAGIILILLFIVALSTYDNSGASPAVLLVDPFGYNVVTEYFASLDTGARNYSYLPLEGYTLANRILWLSLGIVLFAAAFIKFSFKGFLQTKSDKKSITAITPAPIETNISQRQVKVDQKFDFGSFLSRLVMLSALEFKNLVRPVSFRIIVLLAVFMVVLQNLFWNASYYIGNDIPLTSYMTFFRLPWGTFIVILLIIWSGELFFKDRKVEIWQITDALPVPVCITQLSRLFALFGMSFLLSLSFVFVGIVSQTIMGWPGEIDLGRYAEDVLGFRAGLLNYWLFIVLTFFIGALFQNRAVTQIFTVAYYLIIVIAFELGLMEELRFAYGNTPGIEDYSEMNGYGVWATSARYFFLLWLTLAVSLVIFGIWFWGRGIKKKFLTRASWRSTQMSAMMKAFAFMLVALFFLQQYVLHNKVYATDNFKSDAEKDINAASYEKKFSYLKEVSQPKYSKIDLKLNLHPRERRAIYAATIELKNYSKKSINQLVFNFKDFVHVDSLTIEGKLANLKSQDAGHNVYIYSLSDRLKPGSMIVLELKATKTYIGFTQSGKDPQGDLTYNGSFASIREFLPVIGYDDDRELDENRIRLENGLAEIGSRMASVDDSKSLSEDAYTPDARQVTGSITISTDSNQTAVAPGELVKEWKENNRNFRQYEITTPSNFDWHFASANYAVKATSEAGVNVKIYYSPQHTYNLDLLGEVMKKSIRLIGSRFGKYPHKSIQILEVPHYNSDFKSYINTFAVSEKEGWYADTKGLEERAYVVQTFSAQVFKHYIQSNILIANVQGANMLKVGLAEALSLQLLQEMLGKKAYELLTKKKMEKYSKDRTKEANKEPALIHDDGADYLAITKGGVELHRALEEIGFEKFTAILKKWVGTQKGRHTTFESLLKALSPHITKERQFVFTKKKTPSMKLRKSQKSW